MAEEPPDLRYILVEVAKSVRKLRPELVKSSDIERLESANNVLLVLTRILTSLAKESGVSIDEIRNITDKSRKQAMTKTDMFKAKSMSNGTVSGRTDDFEIITMIDMVLLENRNSCPNWFIDDYWPSCLRQVAQGNKLTDRQRAVSLYIHSIAVGE